MKEILKSFNISKDDTIELKIESIFNLLDDVILCNLESNRYSHYKNEWDRVNLICRKFSEAIEQKIDHSIFFLYCRKKLEKQLEDCEKGLKKLKKNKSPK